MLFKRNLIYKEISMIYRQMAFLFASGSTLQQAFSILRDESDDYRMRNMFDAILTQLSNGGPVENSLANYPKFFNKTLIHLLSTEKNLNKISDFLYQYADEIERMRAIKARLVQMLVYPFLILAIATCIVFILMIFVIPVFQDMFNQMGSAARLPGPTQFVLRVSELVKDYAIIIIAVAVCLIVLITQYKPLTYRLGSLIPGIQGLLQDFAIFKFSKYLALLLPLQKPINEILHYAAEMLDNPAYKDRILQLSQTVTTIGQFKAEIQKKNIFPGLFCRTLAIGNHTQALEKLLAHQTTYFEIIINKKINVLTKTIEALSIVLIGIIIGGIVVSMYLPIFKMAGAVG